jgi:RNA 2',3'-cyclic 3'-phosphodiesterase
MMPDRIRAFVALRLSAEVERTVAEFIESLRPPGNPRSAVRWVRRANLHLTLRFLGDRVEAPTLERLDRALIRIAATTPCFTIGVRGIGAFPHLTRPRVVWAGLESTELIALARSLERAAIESGLAPEHRVYSPHLTIGRVLDLGGWSEMRPAIEAATQREFGRSEARSIILYRSTLAVDSASYEELARYPFGDGARCGEIEIG